MNIKWMVFDLGGVIINLNREAGLQKLSDISNKSVDNISEILTEGPVGIPNITKLYMSDKVKTDEYLSYLKDRLDIDIDNILLKKIICSMLNGIDHTIFNLTAQLSTKYKLACYTNTHKIHWDYINQHYNILDIFDKKFSSHITGILKPDPMVFPYIENELPADSSDILFIDDTIKNVEAAEQHGWNVIHHQSTKSTISSLKTFLHNN